MRCFAPVFCCHVEYKIVLYYFKVRMVKWREAGVGGCLAIQRQLGKIAPQSPGKVSIFPVLAFFHLSCPKICQAHPIKICS